MDKLKENIWNKYEDKTEIMNLCEDYRKFISKCKTERECVDEMITILNNNGYKDLEQVSSLKAGDKVYANNNGKCLMMFNIGSDSMENGFNILGSHIDSPRLDVKQNPLYEDNLAMLDTHYYGGIKKYQWVTIPLAIHGIVCKKDGTKINIVIGEDSTDPVVGVSDLLPHLASKQMQERANEFIKGEDLDILVGSIPLKGEEKNAIKANILALLKEKYNIEEDDFLSADLEVVPSGEAKNYGIDNSMIMGYGQDDRICAYTSLLAMLETKPTTRSFVSIFTDKEEIGSNGSTGMQSRFFENTIAEVINKFEDYSDIKLRRALKNSKMLSCDVNSAFDPNFPSVMDKNNCSYFARGIVLNKFTGRGGKYEASEATAEFVAQVRKVFDDNQVSFQMAELGKVDQGGGGTIAYITAQYNMDVLDCGVALISMHAPWEISCKVDIYETKKAYAAFLNNIK